MKGVELYVRVRRAVFIDGMSRREAARLFGIDRRTVDKMLRYSVPPGYRRKKPPARPKLDPFVGFIDQILDEDRQRLKKQRHTSKRIFERLRDEHRLCRWHHDREGLCLCGAPASARDVRTAVPMSRVMPRWTSVRRLRHHRWC